MNNKVLVVDDEKDISRLIQINLRKMGYEAITLNDSSETLALAKRERPGLITLDIMMPGMDGLSVLETLKSDPETMDIPVIMVSIVAKMNKDRSMQLGATGFINKPIDFSLLEKEISNSANTKKTGA